MGGENGVSTGRLVRARGKLPVPVTPGLLLGRGLPQLISATFDVSGRSAILRAYGDDFLFEVQSVDGMGSAEFAAPLVWGNVAVRLTPQHNEQVLDRTGRYRVRLLSGDVHTLAVFLTYNEVTR